MVWRGCITAAARRRGVRCAQTMFGWPLLPHSHECITLMVMSKRLQVLLEEPEYRGLVRIARARGMTVSEWVRHALREAAREEPSANRGRKLAAIRAAATCSHPAGDIDEMLAEIDRGRAMGIDAE
jgi:hypothetical protein